MKQLFQVAIWSLYPVASALPLAPLAGIHVPTEVAGPANNFAVFITWCLALAGLSYLLTSSSPRSKKDMAQLLAYRPTFVNTYYAPAVTSLMVLVYVALGHWWMVAGTFFYIACSYSYKEMSKELKAAQ